MDMQTNEKTDKEDKWAKEQINDHIALKEKKPQGRKERHPDRQTVKERDRLKNVRIHSQKESQTDRQIDKQRGHKWGWRNLNQIVRREER